MPTTHCLTSGSLGTSEVPVSNISSNFNTTQDPGAGNRRGVIVSILGLDTGYYSVPGVISNVASAAPFRSRAGDFANAVQADGWIFMQVPCHEDFCTDNPAYGGGGIYNDIANDTGNGSRFLTSTLHWWDHVVNFIHTTYGSTIPIIPFGQSLGGLKTLIIAANRSVLGYIAHVPAGVPENIAAAYAAPLNFGIINCSGLNLTPTYENAVTSPGIIGYGTNDIAVGWAATTVASGSAGLSVASISTLNVASSTNIISGPNVLLTGLNGGTGRAVFSFTGKGTGTLTGCTLLSGSGTTVSGAPCVQNYTDQIITNAQGAGQLVTRNSTTDGHEFSGTPSAVSGSASSGSLSTSSSTLTMLASTSSFPASGTLVLTHSGVKYLVNYTGISGSTFTGCTIALGSVTTSSGDAVIGGSDAATYAAWIASTLDPLAPANAF